MIIDALTKFCEAEAASGTAATRLEGDVINLVTARDIANGQPLYLVVVVTTTFGQAAGSPTVNIQLASDAQAAIATDGSATVHWQTGALATSVLTAGKTFVAALPLEGVEYEQYLGILVTTAVATTNAGAITAFLSMDPTGWRAYPEADS